MSSALISPFATGNPCQATADAHAAKISARSPLLVGLCLAAAMMLRPYLATARTAAPVAPPGATVTIVPYAGIGNGRFDTLLHGTNWRRLWNTPITVPVIDLQTFAGGLHPLEEGGDHLSKTLLFQGGDGKRYLFVSLAKEPGRELSPNLRGTTLEEFKNKEISSLNPAAELMISPILDAAGLPDVPRRLVVLPRDTALPGSFGEAFCGVAGTIEEIPGSSPTGFMGAERIAGTAELLRELDQDSGNSVDAQAYLKARLVDILVGDGDRMPDQWRWAGYGSNGNRRWVPVPVRHYQAFSRNAGLFSVTPHLQEFGAEYPGMKRLTASARVLDRRILSVLGRAEWMEITRQLQLALTDSVIDEAVRRMPPEMYALEGKRLERDLKSRRERLLEASTEFYLLSARVVKVHASRMAERVSAHRLPGGGVEVELSRKDPAALKPSSTTIFRRTFVPDETKEVRIYTGGGEDEMVVDGATGVRSVVVRIIDPVSAARRPGINPDRPDSGTELTAGLSTAQLNYSSDYAAMAGWGMEFEEYGFDEQPYKYHGELNGAVAFGKGFRYRFGAMGDIATLFGNASLHLEATTNTLDNLSHYGLGNETRPMRPGMDETAFQTRSNSTTLFASLRYPPRFSQAYFWEAGIEAKWITTRAEPNSFFELDRQQIIGSNVDFTNDLQFGFHYDSRDSGREIALTQRTGNGRPMDRRTLSNSAALSGMTIDITGRYYPEGMGNLRSFGKLNGEFRTFVPLNETRYSRLAFRVGGQKNWGGYPWFEAASVGGSSSIRGYDRNRFAGDASVYANTELRLYAGHGRLLVPILYGPLFFVDTGRVFLDGDPSSQWHTGIGGGIWAAFFESRYSAQLTFARGLDSGRLTDGYGIYLLAGFSF
ncbi:MAG: hypothetical protein HGB04_05125 [Chlorobiaceae bacterium]|nr:hypothetical protein [Chlorobiaceae bacterium]